MWIVVLHIPSHAYSQEKEYSPKFYKCIDTAISGSATINCIDDEIKLLDKRLKHSYANLMKIETPERKAELQTAQRLWLQFQKANCNFYEDADGGSMRREMSANCYLESTKNRVNELEYFLFLRKQSRP
jgi:uncharacterized protein YecT (DUF1311 family)